jgi:ubiquinone/menaquinone biosynthesis C-methylase UbiE
LDVGCGAGVTPVLLAKRIGCKVVGVDISEGMVRRSRERASKGSIKAIWFWRYVEGSVQNAFPLQKKSGVQEICEESKERGHCPQKPE